MKIFERIIYIIAIIVLGYFLFKKPIPDTIVRKIPGDSIPYPIVVEKPVPYDTIVYDTLLLAGDTIFLHDTIKVYNDYFKMYSYKLDTSATDVDLSILSYVTQNRLYRQDINILNNRETSIIEKTNNLAVGIIAGKSTLAPAFSYKYSNYEIGVGYNVVNNGLLLEFKYNFKNGSIFK